MKNESPAEKQYRLQGEAECRRIAELVKKEMPLGRAFVLVTADIGGGPNAKFSNTSYVSTANREDSQRLLTELLDHWRGNGLGCEPSVSTATSIREGVFGIRENPTPRLLHGARCSTRDAEAAHLAGDQRRACIQLLKGATELLAVYDQLSRKLTGD